MVGAIDQRIQRNVRNLSDVMSRVGLDPEIVSWSGTALAGAVQNCLWCPHGTDCRHWLDTAGTNAAAIPAFCPNSAFFAIAATAPAVVARWPLQTHHAVHLSGESPHEMVREWSAAVAEYEASIAALDAAEERLAILDPPPPEALFEQAGDRALGLPAASPHRSGRPWYAPIIALVRDQSVVGATTLREARRREIMAAHDMWHAARCATEEACGVGAAATRYKAAGSRVDALRAKMVSTRASTVPGLRQKAEAAIWSAGGVRQLEEGLKEAGLPDVALTMALVRDLLALG